MFDHLLFDPRFELDPFQPFQALRRMQDHWEQLFGAPAFGRPASLPFALFSKDDALLLRTPLPGVEAQDVALEVDGNTLTLSGEWPGEPEGSPAALEHAERPRGKCSRTLQVPFDIDAGRVQARMVRGVLEVEIPKAPGATPTKIQVLPEGKRNSP